MRTRAQAFTLIELLIVVAIIAILAAIAVPNFLEAQVRSKCSRVKADMRTIATAMESYAVDNNKYPPNYDSGFYPGMPTNDESLTFAALTTPIAYAVSAPRDVFRPDPQELSRGNYFEYVASDSVLGLTNGKYTAGLKAFYESTSIRWSISSIGPDRHNDVVGHYMDVAANYTYDPTNGTVSGGDIWRSNKS